jgi:succinyl-diaminopimelate desuccinylase
MSTQPQASGSDLARRLAQTTLALIDTPSESRNEAAIGEVVASMMDTRSPSLAQDHCLLYTPKRRPGTPLVVLAGHLDTVPSQGNIPGRVSESSVHGLGASDMKGSLAVMIHLARWLDSDQPETTLDAAFLFFAREELTIDASPITGLLEASADLRGADLVIILEPTSNAIQLGCLGNLNADVTYSGTSSHSARPWHGDNAIHSAIKGLQTVASSPARQVNVEGLEFFEVVNVTGIEGGIARNVIPDEVVCRVNFRYAPNRTPASAEAELRELLDGGSSLDIVGNSMPARVATDNRLVDRLRVASSAPVEPKQAWTNVAEFSAVGIDAINFGPGAPEYAHSPDELVDIEALTKSLDSLQRFMTAQ